MFGFIVCGTGLRALSHWARCDTRLVRILGSILALAMTAGGTVWAQTIHSQNYTAGMSGKGLSTPRWKSHPATGFAVAPV